MEEVIERGFSRLVELINTKDKAIDAYNVEIRERDADLLLRMASLMKHVIGKIGIHMLEKGKSDNQGEIFDPQYYNTRMILLGKSSEPAPFRPDNMAKKVSDQFCTISEDGKFYEIMYSNDGFVIDSCRSEITPRQVIDLYSYDAIFMLYKAMQQYLENQESLLTSLENVISFINSGEQGL
jgi:hypothetical protein